MIEYYFLKDTVIEAIEQIENQFSNELDFSCHFNLKGYENNRFNYFFNDTVNYV
jgi:hypothetical protein